MIMLSAAHDILKDQEDKDHHDNHNVSITNFNTFYCKVLEKSEYYTSEYYTHIVLVLWSTCKNVNVIQCKYYRGIIKDMYTVPRSQNSNVVVICVQDILLHL